MADIKKLGYILIETTDMDRWRTLGIDVLGLAPGEGPSPDSLYLRLDERAARFVVSPGETDRVAVVGWEVRDGRGLDGVRRSLDAACVPWSDLKQEQCDERRVEQAISFTDPAGTPVEVFHGPVLNHDPLNTAYGNRFVTGSQGLGHVVLPVRDVDEAFAFYVDVLDFLPRGAFRIPTPPEAPPTRLRFLGVNQRHHSLALIPMPATGPGLIHIMIEAETLDEVGRALDRSNAAGFSLSSTLGRHTNDKMVSFYLRAPGGYDIEYGCEGMAVDESFYTTEEITADSYWGHDWSGSEPLGALGDLKEVSA